MLDKSLSPEFRRAVIEKLQECDHKDGVNPEDWKQVEPHLLIIADWYVDYCDRFNLPVKFTSIIRPRIPGVSHTDIHADKRAFDGSLNGWTDADARNCAFCANKELREYGAISAHDKKVRAAVFEDGISAGLGRHLHFQVRP